LLAGLIGCLRACLLVGRRVASYFAVLPMLCQGDLELEWLTYKTDETVDCACGATDLGFASVYGTMASEMIIIRVACA